MSNHIASGVMDAALCNIISLSSTVHIQAHNIIYNCTKWCERETHSEGGMLMIHGWQRKGGEKIPLIRDAFSGCFFLYALEDG